MSVAYNPLSGNFETKEPGPQGPTGVVTAAGDGSQAVPAISFSSDTNTGLYRYAADSIGVSTGGTGRLFVNATGDLGVGTTLLSFAEGSGLRVERSDVATVRLQRTGSHGFEISAQSDKAKFRSVNDKPFVFANGSNSELLRLTSAGRLGLGTSAPAAKLHISDAAAPEFRIVDTTNNCTGFMRPVDSSVRLGTGSNHPLEFHINSSEKMRLTPAGNLGLGVTDPAYELEIGGNSNIQLALTASTTTGNSQIYFGDSADDDAGALIYRHASDSLAFQVNASEAMRLDSNGRLGLGTTNPSSPFVVSDSGAGGVEIHPNSSGDGRLLAYNRSGSAYIGMRYAASNHQFLIGNSEKLRLDSDGRLGLGTTAPSSHLSVKKDITGATAITAANSQVGVFSGSGSGAAHRSTIYFSPVNSSGNGSPAAISAIASGNTNSTLAFYTNGSNNYTGTPVERMRLTDAGRLGLGVSSPATHLHVQGGTSTAARIGSSSTSNFGQLQLQTSGQFLIGYGSTHGSQPNEISLKNSVGDITFYTGGSQRARIDSSGNLLIGGSLPASPNITLRENGTAKFTGRVDSINTSAPTQFLIGTDAGNANSRAQFGYAVGANNFLTGATAGDVCITFPSTLRFGLGGASSTINFGTDGSATFAGDIQSGGDANGGAADGALVRSTGLIQASRGSGSNSLWAGYTTGNSTLTSRINADGSASFAGGIQSASDIETTTAGDGVILKSPNGTRYRLTVANDGTLSTSAA